MTKFKYLLFFLTLVLAASCVKDNGDPSDDNNGGETDYTDKYIIMNEGAFSANNASLSVYNPETEEVETNVFKDKNNYPLGDIAQSMSIVNDSLLWVVVNNSGKIEIVNVNTYEAIGTVEGLTSPRFMISINGKAYVSDIVSKSLSVIDMETLDLIGQVPLPNTVEHIVPHGENEIIAASWVSNNMVYKIDLSSQSVTDSTELAYEPNSMVYDNNGYLWVLCGGGYAGAPFRENPILVKLNPGDMTIESTYPFHSTDSYPSELVYNASDNNLYFIMGTVGADEDLGIYRMRVGDTAVPTSPFVAENGQHAFYKLSIDSEGVLWATDAGDFSSPGTVSKINPDATIELSFTAGIVPSAVLKYSR